ncbi:hypothetical protein TruAng_006309 [Truncatella angustata]|nr:hypothetical protein TruAng_006309 [Truncatella angustata]
MGSLNAFSSPWRQKLCAPHTYVDELPEYRTQSQVDSLITTSHPHSFELGTGASIYTNTILPAILKARFEVILVTCFWAPSSTLTALKDALEQLARRRAQLMKESGPDADVAQPLRVRICFSSRSLFQKLFHTTSEEGYVYPPGKWPTQLGLPHPDVLRAGAIELQVKSLFFLPFSVMHPKFVIVDRQRAWLPSCNVSWEAWLEGCVEITGDAVNGLMAFYRDTWDRSLDITSRAAEQAYSQPSIVPINRPRAVSIGLTSIQSPARRIAAIEGKATPTVLLPSSHHRNPCYRPLPWSEHPAPPSTPLNSAIIMLLDMAEQYIYMQTPNLTSAVVIDGILGAVQRGVEVTIVTSKGMMLLEQIVTAGTTTSICIRSLIGRYNQLVKSTSNSRPAGSAASSEPMIDLEAGIRKIGRLRISYFHADDQNQRQGAAEEPVQSHLKLSIIDKQYTVLGSGNMDRASWFTSQELGILFHSSEFATVVSETVRDGLKGRADVVFDSHRMV